MRVSRGLVAGLACILLSSSVAAIAAEVSLEEAAVRLLAQESAPTQAQSAFSVGEARRALIKLHLGLFYTARLGYWRKVGRLTCLAARAGIIRTRSFARALGRTAGRAAQAWNRVRPGPGSILARAYLSGLYSCL